MTRTATGCRLKTLTICAIALQLLVSSVLATCQSSQPSPEQLIRRVIDHELSAESHDDSHWMFRLETEHKNGQKEVDEVIETKDGDLKRPILINGQPLSEKQRQRSDRQLARNRKAMLKARKDESQDTARSQKMLKMLPNAFTFSYGERRGDLVQLKFKPNPRFRPKSHEAEVFHAMEGTVWVDQKQNRLAEISGHLIKKVKFGGGFLGHLDKGGTFDVKQQAVSLGYWELTQLNVEMNGKALFFKTISVHQKYSRADFRRVPDDLTIAQAAEILKKTPE
ncbi:MAG: hypothetical protein ACRD2U_13585 [Terriglobales bacterium]